MLAIAGGVAPAGGGRRGNPREHGVEAARGSGAELVGLDAASAAPRTGGAPAREWLGGGATNSVRHLGCAQLDLPSALRRQSGRRRRGGYPKMWHDDEVQGWSLARTEAATE